MALVMTATQRVELTVVALDSRGNPAPLEALAWNSSDPGVLEVVPSADGLAAVARAVGAAGFAQVVLTADARIGDGDVPITGLLDVQILPAEATVIQLVAGAPTEQ